MNHYTCTECHTEIPTGEAVLRSVSLQRVAYHQDCYDARVERPALQFAAAS